MGEQADRTGNYSPRNSRSSLGTENTRNYPQSGGGQEGVERRDDASARDGVGIEPEQVPAILRPGGDRMQGFLPEAHDQWARPAEPLSPTSFSEAPTTLRPAPSPSTESNNPFLKKIAEEQTGRKSSITESLGQVSLGEASNNPWHHALDATHTGSSQQSRNPPIPGLAVPEAASNNQAEEVVLWDSSAPASSLAHPINVPPSKSVEDRSAIEDLSQLDSTQSQPTGSSGSNAKVERLDDWNLIDHDPIPAASSSSILLPEKENSRDTDEPPSLPPRPLDIEQPSGAEQTGNAPPPPPPRNARTAVEIYYVKKVRWYDFKASQNPRTSPILIQNENGPCPLVALVNALVLTTPADEGQSYLTHFLGSKDKVELEALLQAVIEELMSRSTSADSVLPDMMDLYRFLASLDTGMNVNPRFLPTEDQITTMKRTSLGHVHPSERDNCIPGGFEDTREMKLYSTFSIPLFHGWIPEGDEPAFAAMKAQAESYDEARILDFKEMDLHQKLADPNGEGLTPEEQDTYKDIMIVKTFLETYSTQLTPYGLEVLRKSMEPGSIAILFRNDHFSTLYKHPETHVLFTLATDAGLANHEEIVWESLANVKGATEFYSGDFRIVGGAQDRQQESPGNFSSGSNPGEWPSIDEASSGGWQTAQGRRRGNNEQAQMPPKHEQEDQDYAMALQLQEEEEERHRREQTRRQQEARLSEQFMEQNGRQPQQGSGDRIAGLRQSSMSAATTGARRPGMVAAQRGQTVRPLVPPAGGSRTSRPAVYRAPGDSGAEAPPSYDESANDTPFRPPLGHPTHPNSPPNNVPVTQGRGSGPMPPAGVPRPGPQRPSRQQIPAGGTMSGSGSHGKKGDCTVM